MSYSKEEVGQLMNEMKDIAKTEAESELIHESRTSVLLLQQCFTQAENGKLQLQTNVAELENKILMDAVAQMEKDDVNGKLQNKAANILGNLINETITQKLQREIEELRKENAKLKSLANNGNTKSAANSAPANTETVLQMQAKLDALQQDLNAKLQNSKPVQNLKKILEDKNADIKSLKVRLSKYLLPMFVLYTCNLLIIDLYVYLFVDMNMWIIDIIFK